jgi:hypothetical protein
MNWIKLILHYTEKHSCKIWAFMAVAHEKKMFKWPYPILWLSPFEEDVNLPLNKFEFQSCKKCLFQLWLKLALCFILKDSFQYTNVKIVPLLVSATLTLGDHNLYKLKSAISQIAFIKMSNSGSVALKEKLFQWPRQIFAFLWLSPLWRGPGPLLV